MRDQLSLGPVPAYEDCQQVGTDSYDPKKAREECLRYINAIRKQHGPEPEGARLRITSNPHDFGTYLDVVVDYDEDSDAAIEYAFKVEGDCPTHWPEEEPAPCASPSTV